MQIAPLPGEEPSNGDLIIIIRLDRQLAPIVTIRNDLLVQFPNGEGDLQVFGPVRADIVYQPTVEAV